MNALDQTFSNFSNMFTDMADTDDLETGLDVLAFTGGLINGFAWTAVAMAFSTVWVGAVIGLIGALITMLLLGMGVTYVGFMHTSTVEAIGRPINNLCDAVSSRVRSWF